MTRGWVALLRAEVTQAECPRGEIGYCGASNWGGNWGTLVRASPEAEAATSGDRGSIIFYLLSVLRLSFSFHLVPFPFRSAASLPTWHHTKISSRASRNPALSNNAVIGPMLDWFQWCHVPIWTWPTPPHGFPRVTPGGENGRVSPLDDPWPTSDSPGSSRTGLRI